MYQVLIFECHFISHPNEKSSYCQYNELFYKTEHMFYFVIISNICLCVKSKKIPANVLFLMADTFWMNTIYNFYPVIPEI